MNAQKLKGEILSQGYTQESFARAIGMSINTLNAKLNGKRKLYVDEAEKIIDVLNISSDIKKCDIFLK